MNQASQSTRGFNIIFIHSSLDDAGLTPHEFRVFAHLSRRASDGTAWPKVESISKITKICHHNVRAAIARLSELRMVDIVERPGKSNLYKLLPPDQWELPLPDQGPLQDIEALQDIEGHPFKKLKGTPSKFGRAPLQKVEDEGNPLKAIQEGHPKRKGKFVPPSEEEAIQRAKEIGLPKSEAVKFVAYYSSKGWLVGKAPMVSWHQAMIGWRTRWQERTYGGAPPPPRFNRPAREVINGNL